MIFQGSDDGLTGEPRVEGVWPQTSSARELATAVMTLQYQASELKRGRAHDHWRKGYVAAHGVGKAELRHMMTFIVELEMQGLEAAEKLQPPELAKALSPTAEISPPWLPSADRDQPYPLGQCRLCFTKKLHVHPLTRYCHVCHQTFEWTDLSDPLSGSGCGCEVCQRKNCGTCPACRQGHQFGRKERCEKRICPKKKDTGPVRVVKPGFKVIQVPANHTSGHPIRVTSANRMEMLVRPSLDVREGDLVYVWIPLPEAGRPKVVSPPKPRVASTGEKKPRQARAPKTVHLRPPTALTESDGKPRTLTKEERQAGTSFLNTHSSGPSPYVLGLRLM